MAGYRRLILNRYRTGGVAGIRGETSRELRTCAFATGAAPESDRSPSLSCTPARVSDRACRQSRSVPASLVNVNAAVARRCFTVSRFGGLVVIFGDPPADRGGGPTELGRATELCTATELRPLMSTARIVTSVAPGVSAPAGIDHRVRH